MSKPRLPAAGQVEPRTLAGGAGDVEALVASPKGVPRGGAVICHPHPLHGGALTNKVTYTLASCALKAGLVATRFNFRGVGRSAGNHDEGRGETEDTLAVCRWMNEALPGRPLLLAGFSFGGSVALRAAARAAPAVTICVAPAFRYFAGDGWPARPPGPWQVVHGREDEVIALRESEAALGRYDPPFELKVVDGAGHFFHGQLGDLEAAVLPFIQSHWIAS